MPSILQNFTAVCAAVVVTEIISRICNKNTMVDFVRALAVLTLILSVVLPLVSVDWSIDTYTTAAESTGDELTAFVQERTTHAAEEEFTQYINGLLQTVGIRAEKIEVITDISDNNCIVLTDVKAAFAYEIDSERAGLLLNNTFGEDVNVEVQTLGH